MWPDKIIPPPFNFCFPFIVENKFTLFFSLSNVLKDSAPNIFSLSSQYFIKFILDVPETVLNFIDNSTNNKIKYDIIFMDPPYKESKIKDLLDLIFKKKIFKKNGLFILHRNKKTKDELPNNFQIILSRSYGLSKIYFGKF